MRVGTGDTIVGRFRLGAEIGGGMTRVFRADDLEREVPVAVKILAGGSAVDHERFAREAALTERLSPTEPGIARYVAQGTIADARFLVLEWLDGLTLADRLEADGVSVAESVVVAGEVSRILATVHAAGLVHRDVKPSNILFTDGRLERPALIDFGIARRAHVPTAITRTGYTVGTPGYMAPEQARADKDIDARADVFALGCVLYECLTGRRAFEGEHATALCAKVTLLSAEPLGEVARQVPTELEALLWRMLARDPATRPRDGGEVHAVLTSLRDLPDAPRRRTGHRAPASPTMKLAATPAAAETVHWLIVAGVSEAPPAGAAAALPAIVAPYGAQVEELADGSVIATLAGAAPDGAIAAVRCALMLRSLAPGTAIAITNSLGAAVRGRRELEDVIDRGVHMLSLGHGDVGADDALAGVIYLDEQTADALAGRYDVRSTELGSFYLVHP